MLEKADVEKIEKINNDSMYIHQSFTSHGSKAYEAYLKMMTGTMRDGNISKMYKELIAIGISSFHNCEPCIVWHIREALKSGATNAQVVEAIDVAIEMGGGPVVARSSFAFRCWSISKTKRNDIL